MSSLNCMFVLSVSTELKWRAWDFRRMMQCTCRPPQALLISSARARNTTLATQSHFYHLAKGRKWSKNTTFVSHRSFVLKPTPWPSLSLLCFRSIQKIGSILEASKFVWKKIFLAWLMYYLSGEVDDVIKSPLPDRFEHNFGGFPPGIPSDLLWPDNSFKKNSRIVPVYKICQKSHFGPEMWEICQFSCQKYLVFFFACIEHWKI